MNKLKLPKILQNADLMYKWPLINIIYRHRISYVLNLFNIKNKKVMDAGCGHGILLYNLSKRGASCTGFDYSDRYIKETKKNFKKLNVKNFKLIRGDLTKIHLPDNSFDIIFCLDVLEHIPSVEQAIKELKRVLKPNGRFIISAPTENMWYVIARTILRMKKPIDHYWTAKQIKDIISKELKITKVKSIYPFFDFFKIIVSKK